MSLTGTMRVASRDLSFASSLTSNFCRSLKDFLQEFVFLSELVEDHSQAFLFYFDFLFGTWH